MSQLERWVNYYNPKDRNPMGLSWKSRDLAVMGVERGNKPLFRIHVKLKPEGAPRRYASEHDRRNWETYPEEMRKCPF